MTLWGDEAADSVQVAWLFDNGTWGQPTIAIPALSNETVPVGAGAFELLEVGATLAVRVTEDP